MISTMKLSYMGKTGVAKVNGDAYAATVYLPPQLWKLYAANAETVGAVLANYVRQAFGWPRGLDRQTIIAFRQK